MPASRERRPAQEPSGYSSSPEPFSGVDREIIAHLSRDARTSFADIGAQVGLSASAVKRRVDRLRQDGVIERFTVQLRTAPRNGGVEAYVELYCRGRTAPPDIRRSLERHPEVVHACTITGDADALVRIRARDVTHLEDVLEEIRSEHNVERTRSVLVLSTLLSRENATSEM